MILDMKIMESVCGLERVRQMCQNDAHLFVRQTRLKKK